MDRKLKIGSYVKDIRFWIVFFFLVRLYGITFPPLEVGHNWRQTDGLMIVRNFYERSTGIFYPTVDLAGEKTGIVGCEFPILNYLTYVVSLCFGYEHWYGRLVVLIFSSLGIFFFYRLIKDYFGESTAFNAAFILIVSLWFSYSRKMIPDTFGASLCIISLFFAFRYFREGKTLDVLSFFLLALLGCLSKIMGATILTVMLFPVLDKNISLARKAVVSAAAVLILALVYAWYFSWVPHLNRTYGFGDHFSMGMPFTVGVKDFFENGAAVFKRFYSTPLKYVGFITLLGSVIYAIYKRSWLPLSVFLLPFSAYLILLLKTGANIIGDHYYILTAIPAMAFVTGWGLSQISNTKIAIALLAIIGIENIAAQIYDFRIRQPFKALEKLEAIMDNVSQRDDLIVINSEVHNPTPMYFAHRRGWGAPNAMLSGTDFLDDIKTRGCHYVVIVKKLYGDLNLAYPVVHDSEDFKIYSLKSP